MPRLTIAREDQVDAIYAESHALWGAGLCLADYRALWRDISRTRWARRHVRFCVWQGEGGEVLSSLKLYRPPLRLLDRTTTATVIGALFTPRALRGRGYATALVRAVLQRAAERGESPALLFSDIGTGYYSRLGFRELPADEQWGTLPLPAPIPPGWALRPMREGDREPIRRAHEESSRHRSIAILRDVEHWRFLFVRAEGFFERLGREDLCQRCFVALVRDVFAGYVITVEGRGESGSVREVGARDGDADAMATILRLAGSAAHERGQRVFYGWLPPEVRTRLSGWRLSSRSRRRAIPMIQFLGEAAVGEIPESPELAYLSFQDQF